MNCKQCKDTYLFTVQTDTVKTGRSQEINQGDRIFKDYGDSMTQKF